MKTRAAVAWKAGAPLTIEELDLEGPRAGEVLVEIKATGICHTDYYTLSGADPEGLFPAVLGHEGQRGIGPLVALGAARASQRLLFVFRRQHAERDGRPGLECELLQSGSVAVQEFGDRRLRGERGQQLDLGAGAEGDHRLSHALGLIGFLVHQDTAEGLRVEGDG